MSHARSAYAHTQVANTWNLAPETYFTVNPNVVECVIPAPVAVSVRVVDPTFAMDAAVSLIVKL